MTRAGSSWLLSLLAAAANATPEFSAPATPAELETRLSELRAQYAPYLRSLPPPLPERERTLLPAEWRFTFEAKAKPKAEGIPPAPAWQGADFDDAAWEATTVPEWRYRTRLSDTALNPDQVAQWKNPPQLTADTICWYRTAFPASPSAPGQRQWLCFDGVEWEAQVWLNGEFLGGHAGYYEAFRFDVTDRLRGTNTLAVRVIAGRSYGQPVSYWGLFPDIRAADQRYVPDRDRSIRGNLPIGYHAGGGFGIHRAVYLERSGPVRIDAIFARHDLADGQVRVKVEVDSAVAGPAGLRIEVLPENFEGTSYRLDRTVTLTAGASVQEFILPMPDARVWSPDQPHLYRCRVAVADSDTRDALFGCRSFTLVHHDTPPPLSRPVYTFPPVRASWLRVVGRGSDASSWNSIWELECAALARGTNATAGSQSHRDYPAAFAIDGRDDTRWAIDGRGTWLQLKLDPAVAFDRVAIGWYEADLRTWDFDLQVSADGETWTPLAYARPAAGSAPPRDGMFALNGRPTHLRGTNIQGLNAYWYWGQTNELLNALLLLKAAHFNAVRSCQHIEFPEVLEWMDRVGMLSEQDQGGGYSGSIDMGIRREPHIRTGTAMARATYNHPGVVLLSFGNEHEFPTEPIVRAALAVDPQRVFKPISGRFTHSGKPWDLPADLRANAIDDGHPYSGWYGSNVPQTWHNLKIFTNARMVTLGEYGAEGLDAYETMRDHYPPQFQPPPPGADTLWAASQVQKRDVKQVAGLGRTPTNLAEYIEASQLYQASLMADKTIGMRLSPRAIAGYFHFHFLDAVPVFWPKSIVSHDQRPKLAYYQMAQVNQPVVALPQLAGLRPDQMTLWVANDLADPLPGATLRWTVSRAGRTLLEGQQRMEVPALGAVAGPVVDLRPITSAQPDFDLDLRVLDGQGRPVSRYRRTVRVPPSELLPKSDATADPFNP